MIDQAGLERLREFYRFDEWAGRSRTEGRLFVAGYDVRRMALAEGEATERVVEPAEPALPKMTRLFWKPPGEEDVIVDVQLFECNSRAQAHHYLLQFLGSFQSPQLARRDDVPWSDVCFTTAGEGAVLFARGNLVHVIRNAGPRRIPLLGIAARLDAPLAEAVAAAPQPAPRRAKKRGVKAAARPEERRAAVGESIPLPHAPRPSAEVRVVARGGDVVRAGDALVYVPDRPGEHEVRLETVGDPAAPPAVEQLKVTVT